MGLKAKLVARHSGSINESFNSDPVPPLAYCRYDVVAIWFVGEASGILLIYLAIFTGGDVGAGGASTCNEKEFTHSCLDRWGTSRARTQVPGRFVILLGALPNPHRITPVLVVWVLCRLVHCVVAAAGYGDCHGDARF